MSTLTRLPFGFPGEIYRSPMPLGPYDPRHELLKLYQAADLDMVVMLSAQGEDLRLSGHDLTSLYRQMGMEVVHLPIADFQTPDRSALAGVLEKIQSAASQGQNVVVHCSAGLGRTGMLLACLAKQTLGLDGAAAIQWVRQYIPGAVETDAQSQFVNAF
jgi:protein-tyrosine phosphatase